MTTIQEKAIDLFKKGDDLQALACLDELRANLSQDELVAILTSEANRRKDHLRKCRLRKSILISVYYHVLHDANPFSSTSQRKIHQEARTLLDMISFFTGAGAHGYTITLLTYHNDSPRISNTFLYFFYLIVQRLNHLIEQLNEDERNELIEVANNPKEHLNLYLDRYECNLDVRILTRQLKMQPVLVSPPMWENHAVWICAREYLKDTRTAEQPDERKALILFLLCIIVPAHLAGAEDEHHTVKSARRTLYLKKGLLSPRLSAGKLNFVIKTTNKFIRSIEHDSELIASVIADAKQIVGLQEIILAYSCNSAVLVLANHLKIKTRESRLAARWATIFPNEATEDTLLLANNSSARTYT